MNCASRAERGCCSLAVPTPHIDYYAWTLSMLFCGKLTRQWIHTLDDCADWVNVRVDGCWYHEQEHCLFHSSLQGTHADAPIASFLGWAGAAHTNEHRTNKIKKCTNKIKKCFLRLFCLQKHNILIEYWQSWHHCFAWINRWAVVFGSQSVTTPPMVRGHQFRARIGNLMNIIMTTATSPTPALRRCLSEMSAAKPPPSACSSVKKTQTICQSGIVVSSKHNTGRIERFYMGGLTCKTHHMCECVKCVQKAGDKSVAEMKWNV